MQQAKLYHISSSCFSPYLYSQRQIFLPMRGSGSTKKRPQLATPITCTRSERVNGTRWNMDAVIGMYGIASVGTIDDISAMTNNLFLKALRPIRQTLCFSDRQFQTTNNSNMVACMHACMHSGSVAHKRGKFSGVQIASIGRVSPLPSIFFPSSILSNSKSASFFSVKLARISIPLFRVFHNASSVFLTPSSFRH